MCGSGELGYCCCLRFCYGELDICLGRLWLLKATRNFSLEFPRVSLSTPNRYTENFHIVYTKKACESSVGVTPTCGGVEIGVVVILPVPRSLEGWLGFERNGRGATTPDARFGDYPCPGVTVGVLTVPLKGY